ncbi:hypothetical protein [Streptomyces sp. NPDC057623]|uniref:hypothetical protein n=1 Tax=Streptomyces sp. NPDC057623 TaxID=3346187 RepID=UPI0036B85751
MDMELAEMIKRGREQRGLPPSEPQEPQPCKTRKLSDEEIRQRREYADAVREARQKKQPPPRPPWVNPEADRELIEKIHRLRLESCPQYRGMYGPEAMERFKQRMREGYGDAVPDFEESE